uniref:Circadian clock-controlled protein n=1 Tax=Bactrocera dorsalis TaxID=27457 RepID=A0A034WBE7_BACDO
MHLRQVLGHACVFVFFCWAVCAQDVTSSAATAATTTTVALETSPATTSTTLEGASTAEISSTASSVPINNPPTTVSVKTSDESKAVDSATSANAAASASKPKKYFTVGDLPVCKQSSPEFNDCVKNLVQKSLQRLKNGDRDLNIPIIDPYKLNRTTFQYTSGTIRGRIIMRDGLTYGFSKTEIKSLDLKINGDKVTMKSLSYVPVINIVGNYKAELILNNIQLRPKGVFNVSLVNVNIDQTHEGTFYEADGHRFVRMRRFDAEPKVGDFKLSATGVFPDPTLNELAVNIVNQYWRQIFQVFLPETRQYWGPLLLQQLNEVMSVVPYDVFVVD